MSTSRTIQLNTPVFPKPFIKELEYDPFGLNETADIVIKGGYFNTGTTVAITGQVVNNVIIQDDDEMLVNITTGSTVGLFDVEINNGASATMQGGFEVKNKTVLIPNDGTTVWERISANVVTALSKVVPTTTASGWTKGASFGTVAAVTDFLLEFNPAYMVGQSSGGYAMIGMDSSDPNFNYNTIDYAIYLQNGINLYVFENGASKGLKGTWQINDVLGIRRTGTTIEYLKNGNVFYTSTTSSSSNMVFDTSLYRYLGAEKIKLTYFN